MGRVARRTSEARRNLREALQAKATRVSVGWMEGAKYDDKNETPVAYVASIMEFGYAEGGIPPRSFMRTTIEEKKGEWKALGQSGAKAVLAGNATIHDVMEGVGLQAAGDIRKKITEITEPALADSTIKSRQRKLADGKTVGSLTKPLVETSLMLTSLTSVVEEK